MIRIWHPMRDPHHCSFRILSLLLTAGDVKIPTAKISFLDLFYLFPEFIRELQLTREDDQKRRKLNISTRVESFVHIPELPTVYRELQIYQKITLDRLAAQDIIDHDNYIQKNVFLNVEKVPDELLRHIYKNLDKNKNLLSFIVRNLIELPIDGSGGLLRQGKLELGGRLQ